MSSPLAPPSSSLVSCPASPVLCPLATRLNQASLAGPAIPWPVKWHAILPSEFKSSNYQDSRLSGITTSFKQRLKLQRDSTPQPPPQIKTRQHLKLQRDSTTTSFCKLSDLNLPQLWLDLPVVLKQNSRTARDLLLPPKLTLVIILASAHAALARTPLAHLRIVVDDPVRAKDVRLGTKCVFGVFGVLPKTSKTPKTTLWYCSKVAKECGDEDAGDENAKRREEGEGIHTCTVIHGAPLQRRNRLQPTKGPLQRDTNATAHAHQHTRPPAIAIHPEPDERRISPDDNEALLPAGERAGPNRVEGAAAPGTRCWGREPRGRQAAMLSKGVDGQVLCTTAAHASSTRLAAGGRDAWRGGREYAYIGSVGDARGVHGCRAAWAAGGDAREGVDGKALHRTSRVWDGSLSLDQNKAPVADARGVSTVEDARAATARAALTALTVDAGTRTHARAPPPPETKTLGRRGKRPRGAAALVDGDAHGGSPAPPPAEDDARAPGAKKAPREDGALHAVSRGRGGRGWRGYQWRENAWMSLGIAAATSWARRPGNDEGRSETPAPAPTVAGRASQTRVVKR
ncbi:hypothetical protein C8R46DRAFT_1194198 [Mycena filopes]|nr:hypothetical protein C8R46DRAFT_1194198 [Mycena filopes]